MISYTHLGNHTQKYISGFVFCLQKSVSNTQNLTILWILSLSLSLYIYIYIYIYIYVCVYVYVCVCVREREREKVCVFVWVCVITIAYVYIFGGVCGIMVIVLGNGHSDPSSNLWFHIALIPFEKVCIQLFSLQLRANNKADWSL